MQNLFKQIGFSLTGLGAVFMFGAANAAETGRAAYNIAPANRAGVVTGQQRMPTMGVLPGNATGNMNVNTGANTVKCPDGGVQTSEYTIDSCITDVTTCVNNGALPGGLNDLFNEDLRNSIFNGMSLCYAQVDKCISDVRKNCKNVYATSSDFWLDYNSRKIQPEYYSFVLRKTGLTPNQAENTCWLLDKNTFGSSFAAIANDGSVTSEYDSRIGAYNNAAGGNLTKNSPQGVAVNNNNPGVDGQRGHYARWDAAKGECLVRVAAYNKNSQIKNSWLFGVAGNDQPAEVWRAAGNSFSCNKDLFGFGLMTQTKTTAVVGVGGGTLVGAGIGALAGHGERRFDCEARENRDKLSNELRETDTVTTLQKYVSNFDIQNISDDIITKRQCEQIVKLYDKNKKLESLLKVKGDCDSNVKLVLQSFTKNGEEVDFSKYNGSDITIVINRTLNDAEKTELKEKGFLSVNIPTCSTYHSLQVEGYENDIVCNPSATGSECKSFKDIKSEVEELNRAFNKLSSLSETEESNMLASTAIGAGAGAAAGGLATAITAFVEKNNINCRVGDGLQKVDFGKSYSIGSLKDFYVKWNLRLPDTIMPTATATDCASWKNACSTLKDLNQCATAQINYKPVNSTNTVLVSTACAVSGSTCVDNHPVAVSNGACQ